MRLSQVKPIGGQLGDNQLDYRRTLRLLEARLDSFLLQSLVIATVVVPFEVSFTDGRPTAFHVFVQLAQLPLQLALTLKLGIRASRGFKRSAFLDGTPLEESHCR